MKVIVVLFATTPAMAQGINPQAALDELVRQQQMEMQQRFQDRQRQRQLDEEERAYDRKMCIQAGYTAGPDIEQCVVDSAAWRRGSRSRWQSEPDDFSAYGKTPDELKEPSSSARADLPLKRSGGIFVVPVEINGTMTLEFGVDSGAADVSIPLDVFSTLKRTGTIRESDIVGQKTYVLADGTKLQSATFKLRSLKVGDRVVENVVASVAPSGGPLLLGQSFLGRFKSWSIDNKRQQLVLEP